MKKAILPLAILSLNCGFNNVLYHNKIFDDQVNARVTRLGGNVGDLVVSMENEEGNILEEVFQVSWIPRNMELGDYNSDGRTDVKLIDGEGNQYIFYQNDSGFNQN